MSSLLRVDEFRTIKRKILTVAFQVNENNLSGEAKNRILITSINPKAGKTFITNHLANSLSLEKDKTVLLVDGNILDSSSTAIGLTDYLSTDTYSLSDVLIKKDGGNLTILPAGTPETFAHELLSSNKMKNLMGEFNKRYKERIVLIDSPSLLNINETVLLTYMVDQIVIVIEEGETSLSDLYKVQQLLPKNIPIHYVLNKSSSKVKKTKKLKKVPLFNENDKTLTGSSALN